jgi:hypothetical protein
MSGRFNIDKRSYDPNFNEGVNVESIYQTITTYSQYSNSSNNDDIYTPLMIHIFSLLVLVISVIVICYYFIIPSIVALINIIKRTYKQCWHSAEIYEYSIST